DRIISAGAAYRRIGVDRREIPDVTVGELDLLKAPVCRLGVELLIECDGLSVRIDGGNQMCAYPAERQIAGIQIGEAKGVDVRGGAGFVVDVIVAVTQRIDVGVAAGAAVELVVTQATKEDIIGSGPTQRIIAGCSS